MSKACVLLGKDITGAARSLVHRLNLMRQRTKSPAPTKPTIGPQKDHERRREPGTVSALEQKAHVGNPIRPRAGVSISTNGDREAAKSLLEFPMPTWEVSGK